MLSLLAMNASTNGDHPLIKVGFSVFSPSSSKYPKAWAKIKGTESVIGM